MAGRRTCKPRHSYSLSVVNSYFATGPGHSVLNQFSEAVSFILEQPLLCSLGILYILYDVSHLDLWLSKCFATAAGSGYSRKTGKRKVSCRENKKAVIPAAGLGTRFLVKPPNPSPKKCCRSWTSRPFNILLRKPCSQASKHPGGNGRNKQTLEDHFDRSLELGRPCRGRQKRDAENRPGYFRDGGRPFHPAERAPGPAAVLCARQFVGDEPFAVLLADDIGFRAPALRQMMGVYEVFDTEIVGVQEVSILDVSKYGIVSLRHMGWQEMGDVLWAHDLVEKPPVGEAPSNLAIMGRYILTPLIFPVLENLKPGKGGEIQLTDALKELCRDNLLLAQRLKGQRFDVGDKLSFLQATINFALKRPDLRSRLLAYMSRILHEEKLLSGSRRAV